MAGKSDYFENALLQMIFDTTVVTGMEGIFANPGSPAADLYVSLHTNDPGENAAHQAVNECVYDGYARQAVSRTTGFTVTANSVSPAANIDFPLCTANPETVRYFGVGTTSAGSAGRMLYSGPITPNIVMALATIPRLTTASTITED